MVRRMAKVDKSLCVACGSCIKVCPKQAISIYRECMPRWMKVNVSAVDYVQRVSRFIITINKLEGEHEKTWYEYM